MRYTLIERVIHKMEQVEKLEINNKRSKEYIAGYRRALSLVRWFKNKSDDQFEIEARHYFTITDEDIVRNKGIYEKLTKNRRRR